MNHQPASVILATFTSRNLPSAWTEDYAGPLTCTADGIMSGHVAGDLRIASGAHVKITGHVDGSLIVERRAAAILSGHISRGATIEGALLVSGHVDGAVTGNGVISYAD
jgi:hypothetical protein